MAGFLSDFGIGGSHIHSTVEERIGKHTVLVKQRLAEGAYGLVDLVIDTHSHKEFVLKRCSIQRQETYDIVNKEIKILTMFAGPYVVEYHGSEIVNQSRGREALILLSYCSGGNLFQKLSARGVENYLPYKQCLSIFQQVLLSVQRFHENMPPVTHRDLKLENLLFAADGNIRLCDFGSCSIGYTFLRNQTERSEAEEIIAKETTPMYRAPEMIDLYMREELTEKTDIWALGCIFSTICYLKHPFQDVGTLGILNGRILPFPTDSPMPAHIKELVMRMLDPDPEARPSINEMLSWLQELSQNQPLPTHILSEEAIQKREARIQASLMRNQKNALKKQPKLLVPEKKGGNTIGVASDSVAAKRLAAKRGVDPTTAAVSTSFPSPAKNTSSINNKTSNSNSNNSSSHTSSASTSTNNNNNTRSNNNNIHTSVTTTIGFVQSTSESLFDADFADFGSSSSTTVSAAAPVVATTTTMKTTIQKTSPAVSSSTTQAVVQPVVAVPSRQNSFQGVLPTNTSSSSALSSHNNSFSLPRAPSVSSNTNTPYKNKINSNHSNNNSFRLNNTTTSQQQQQQQQHITANLLFDFDESFGVTHVATPPASPTATAHNGGSLNNSSFFNDDDDDDVFNNRGTTNHSSSNNHSHGSSNNNIKNYNSSNNHSHNSSSGNINSSHFQNSLPLPPNHITAATSATSHGSHNASAHDIFARGVSGNNTTANNSNNRNSGHNSTSNSSPNNSSPSASSRPTSTIICHNNTTSYNNSSAAAAPALSSSFSFKATENQHFTDPFNLNATFPSFSNNNSSSSSAVPVTSSSSSSSLFSGFDNFDTTTTTTATTSKSSSAGVEVKQMSGAVTKSVDPFLTIPPLLNNSNSNNSKSHQPFQSLPPQPMKPPSPPISLQSTAQQSTSQPSQSLPVKPARSGINKSSDLLSNTTTTNHNNNNNNNANSSVVNMGNNMNNNNTANTTRSFSKSADVSYTNNSTSAVAARPLSDSFASLQITSSSSSSSGSNTQPFHLQSPLSSSSFDNNNWSSTTLQATEPWSPSSPFVTAASLNGSGASGGNQKSQSSLSTDAAIGFDKSYLDVFGSSNSNKNTNNNSNSSNSNSNSNKGVIINSNNGSSKSINNSATKIKPTTTHSSSSSSTSSSSTNQDTSSPFDVFQDYYGISNNNNNNHSNSKSQSTQKNTMSDSKNTHTTHNHSHTVSSTSAINKMTKTPSPPLASATTTSASANVTDDEGPDLIQLEPLPSSHTRAMGPVDLLSFDLAPMMSRSNNNNSLTHKDSYNMDYNYIKSNSGKNNINPATSSYDAYPIQQSQLRSHAANTEQVLKIFERSPSYSATNFPAASGTTRSGLSQSNDSSYTSQNR